MNIVKPHSTLAEIIDEHPSLARSLEQRGLDYCCGGGATLGEACVAAGLDTTSMIDELAASIVDEQPASWTTMGIVQLVDHIETTHHAYLWDELARLSDLVDKVVDVHRDRHPELENIANCFGVIRAEFEPHLTNEELVLFPMIRRLAVAGSAEDFPGGSIGRPISTTLAEHDSVGELLRRLRAFTDDYHAPDDGCASYRALFAGFKGLESDTHLHVHKENNVLIPAVIAVEQRLAS